MAKSQLSSYASALGSSNGSCSLKFVAQCPFKSRTPGTLFMSSPRPGSVGWALSDSELPKTQHITSYKPDSMRISNTGFTTDNSISRDQSQNHNIKTSARTLQAWPLILLFPTIAAVSKLPREVRISLPILLLLAFVLSLLLFLILTVEPLLPPELTLLPPPPPLARDVLHLDIEETMLSSAFRHATSEYVIMG